MKKMIFLAVIVIWLFFGGMGIMTCKNDETNWWMVVFFIMTPLLAIIASFCGLM